MSGKLHLVTLAALLVAAPNMVSAQTTAPAGPAQQSDPQAVLPGAPQTDAEDPAEFPQAVRLLTIMNAAFANEQINEVTKGKLFNCIFYNSLQTLNKGVQSTFKDNPELSFENDAHLFRVATAICGVTREELTQPNSPVPGAEQPQAPQGQEPGR